MTGTSNEHDFTSDIEKALATCGGHLAIGPVGYSLHYGRGATLSGYDPDRLKTRCIEAVRSR